MKALALFLICMSMLFVACNNPKNDKIAKYREQYSKLMDDFKKETDSDTRAKIEQQLDDLKKQNLHLFKK